jgi:hypothetical protein
MRIARRQLAATGTTTVRRKATNPAWELVTFGLLMKLLKSSPISLLTRQETMHFLPRTAGAWPRMLGVRRYRMFNWRGKSLMTRPDHARTTPPRPHSLQLGSDAAIVRTAPHHFFGSEA